MMPQDESIRTDASTVHRAGEPAAEPISNGSVDVNEIAQAKTVIRGSSRVDKSNDPLDALDRTPAAVAQVLLGQRLNHFRLDALIGGGGMGAVFRAHDEQLDRTVAIKVIPFVGDDPDLQRRFRNEAQSAAKLDHPRIARVFDVGSHGDWHYIVFEYIEGTNIRDLVTSDGVMSIDDTVYYTSQLADALQHAADRGIVHRDIKPSNVLIGTGGKIKLVDMGLARSDNLDLSEDMTASGVTLGTFDYISPEQARDPRDADLRSDIYSLGCTLYFMLTGSPPYPGGTMLQKLLSHGNAPPPDARELRPEVSDNLVAVLRKMLAKDPADRYQTATDLAADLREVAFRDGLPRSQSLNPVTIAQPNQMLVWFEKHAPWIVAAMLLIASAGWLQLESAALRDAVSIPESADAPLVSTAKSPLVADSALLLDNNAAGPTMAETTADEDASRDGFGPPDQPPKLVDVASPAELDESTTGTEMVPDSYRDRENDPFFIRSPFLDAEASMSPEPEEREYPSLVRIVAPDALGSEAEEEGLVMVTTLSEALALAAEYKASRIEIAVPTLVSEPLKVEVDDLLITSTIGGSQIIFQPFDSVAMERSKMFSIGSHQVVFEDIHFVWNVPSGDIDGGTLFELNDNRLVRLTDCSITVSNPTLREEVYAFDVITDPDKLSSERLREANDFPLVWLELNNVVVRGQMTMLHMDYAAKLLLDWDNGLLAITDHMIDTAGALEEPPSAAGSILLKLWRVTAHAPKGIARMRLGVSGAYSVPIDRLAYESVFVVDPASPHFEFTGLPTLDESNPLLQLRGGSNAYVVEPTLNDPMLSLEPYSGEPEVTRMNDILTSTPDWAVEKSPRWSVNWINNPLPSTPASQRLPADYRQNDPSPLGFSEESLPILPSPGNADLEASSMRAALRKQGNREEL
ncbi:MAG: serine/threonine-protein kinase [Rubripirellula sp.]